MPKSSKKRKDKAADFAKAKLKLGKGKQPASNVIDTSFKARSIALPSQSIAKPKDSDAPTTKRKLTFEDLLTHLKHYSAATRRDAILGLRELLDSHWELMASCLTPLINAMVRTIPDEDSSVRKTLLRFFGWLLPRIDSEDILPHSSVILLFVTSAQTHIFPEIRIDAIKFLNVLLEHVPLTVIDGWNRTGNTHGARVLEGYLGLLNAGTRYGGAEGPAKATSTASVVLTPTSKLVVLQSLSTFLQKALDSESNDSPIPGPSTATIPIWYMASSFRTLESYEGFKNLIEPCTSQTTSRPWEDEVDQDNVSDISPNPFSSALLDVNQDWSVDDFATTGHLVRIQEIGSADDSETTLIARIAGTLSSTLVSTFLDCAPAVFSPGQSPSETELRTVLAVAEIVRSLYGSLLKSPLKDDMAESVFSGLQTILGYMGGYFPFQASGGGRNVQVEQSFQDLNIIFCEMTSLLSLTANVHDRDGIRPRRQNRAAPSRALSGNGAMSIQTERISEYITLLLHGESVAANQLGRPMTSEAYRALLPAIWALLNRPTLESSNSLFGAVIAHSIGTPSKSASKPLTIAFIARLVLLESDPHYEGDVRASHEERIVEWVSHLPQTLWEFGTSTLAGSEIILRFLLRIFQRKTQFSANQTVITSLQSKLVPYFSITHPTRGQVSGPFSKLPSSSPLRRLVLDLVATLTAARGTTEAPSLNPLTAAVHKTICDSQEASYLAHIGAHIGVY